MMSSETYHAIVAGGSFAGLAAAIQLGRARRRVLVVDAGKPRNRFARSSHGFLGQDGRSPAEILETFRAQVAAYPTVGFRDGEVSDARRSADGDLTVTLAPHESLRARRLILATGVVDELPELPGLQERWGVTVLHCPYCHGYEVGDRRLGVLASSEMDLHKALLLPDWSSDVTLFTNGVLEPSADQRAALRARGVRLEERAIEALVGAAPELTGVRLRDGGLVETDALFIGPRIHLTSPLAQRLGCAIDDGPFGPLVRTDERQETTVPGVFCAGDAARTRHSALWATADGAMAGMSAHQSLVFAPAPGR